MSKDWPQKFYKKNVRFNIEGVENIVKSIERSLPHTKVRIGLLSKGKLNKKKTFFAAKGGPEGSDRQPARSPAKAFLESGEAEKVRDNFAKATQKGINDFIQANKTGEDKKPLKYIKKAIRKEFPSFKSSFRVAFDYILPPITKRLKAHKSLIPLVETGKLRKSVTARFVRVKKKKK